MGGGRVGMKLLNDGGDEGGDKSLLLFLLKLTLPYFRASNLLCMSISTPGCGDSPPKMLVTSFLPISSSLNKDSMTRFWASKVKMF